MTTMDKQSVLIVEDDKQLLDALEEKLESNFTIFEATNGEEALDAALKNHPDLILLDIILPKTNGMVVMQKLREDEWGKKVPIIILSNLNPNDRMVSEIVRDEPSYYLLKATTPIDDVVGKVKEVLGKE